MSNLSSLLLATVLALAALTACNKDNPNFCEGTAEECMGIDAPIDSPPVSCNNNGPDPSCPAANPVCTGGECVGACTGDTDCANRPPNESVCHVGSGACVQCDEDDRQAATPGEDECTAPQLAVCDAGTHTCRACEAHIECASGVCDEGRCAPESEVLYLHAENGNDGNACTRQAPCLTVNKAVDDVQAMPATLHYIHLAPDADTQYQARTGNGSVDLNNVTVLIVGTGATVTRAGAGPTVEVKGGSDVRIDGLTVTGGSGGSGYGIEVTAASTLELFEASVTGNGARGITASGASSLVIRRSRITLNSGGGIFVDTGKVTIINNVIGGNGNLLNSLFGGLSLNLTENPNVIEFNTIVGNSALPPNVDGMICNNNTVVARNNIVIGASTSPQVSGSCMHRYTLFTPTGPAAEGNMDIAAVDMGMYAFTPDHHIGPNSVAIGKAQPGALAGESSFDIDGDSRPAGTAPNADVGADEAP